MPCGPAAANPRSAPVIVDFFRPGWLFLTMLVCQCNVITDREIARVIRALLADDPWQIIVPAKVYRELEKRCKCSGCVPSVVELITTVTADYHRELAETSAGAQPAAAAAPPRRQLKGRGHERRSAGHRTA